MKEYFYKAKKTPTETVDGSIKAESREAALLKLSEEGLFPFEMREKLPKKDFFKEIFSPRSVSGSKMASFTRNISDLLDGGVSVLEAFTIVSRQITHSRLKELTEKIRKDLRDGQSLSMSLSALGSAFSPLFISLVKAGEASGTLESSFSRISDFYERRNNLRNSLLKSIAYPSFLMLVGVLTVSVLFVFIIPKLRPVFQDMGVSIPLITQILLSAGDSFRKLWQPAVVILGILFLSSKHFLSSKEGRFFFQSALLRIPFIRGLVLKRVLAESFYSLGTLVQNGVPLSEAIEITRDSTSYAPLARDLSLIASDFRKGKSLSELMERSPLFFPEAVNVIQVGEKTGNLEKPLLKLSQNYERDVQRNLEAFITIIEPSMILIFGLTVGFVAIAILLPIFQLNFSLA